MGKIIIARIIFKFYQSNKYFNKTRKKNKLTKKLKKYLTFSMSYNNYR